LLSAESQNNSDKTDKFNRSVCNLENQLQEKSILPRIPEDGIHLHLNGESIGPFSLEYIVQKFNAGELERNTPLWFEGLKHWIAVGDVPGIDRRKAQEPVAQVPQKDRPDALIIQLKGVALPISPGSLKAMVQNHDYRRTDLVYDDASNGWVRADQHDEVRAFFGAPPPPPPKKSTDSAASTLQHRAARNQPAKIHYVSDQSSAGSMIFQLLLGLFFVGVIIYVLFGAH
jgi:hypothetical protein